MKNRFAIMFHKILILTLFASLVCSIQAETGASLIQIKFKESNSPYDTNTYKCIVGSLRTDNFACVTQDKTTYNNPNDVELKLRCPQSGSGKLISYVEIEFSVTSSNVNCAVTEGDIGLTYIGITISTTETLILNYSAKFSTY